MAMDDLLLRGGLIAGRQQDVAIQQGRIRHIAPHIDTPAQQTLEVTGKLVLPGFIEAHIHLDKAFVADRAPELQRDGPTPQVLVAELKRAFTVEDIYQTIAHGIRHPGDEETRISEMPAFGEILEPDQIKQVAAYVVSLTGKPSDVALVEPGKQVFADNCAACHGEDAKGNREMGAPDLADAIWLKGEGEAAIAAQVRTPKHGVMPAWLPRLGDPAVKQLAVFVHALGGGE